MGGAAGYLLVKVMPHDAWFRRHIIASVMFGRCYRIRRAGMVCLRQLPHAVVTEFMFQTYRACLRQQQG